MAVYNTRLSNTKTGAYTHTVTSTDVTDGYITVSFETSLPLAGMVQATTATGVIRDLATAVLTYPAAGQMKLAPSGGGVAEVSTVTTVADDTNSLSGTYFTFYSGADAAFYAWLDTEGISEISSVDTVADVAGSLNNTYFTISSTSVDYYVWYNVNAGGSDPAPGGTGIEVAIATGATADAVALATETAMEAVGSGAVFDVAVSTNEMTITHLVRGVCTDVADTGSTGFTVAVDTQGVAKSTDPAPGGTGIEVPSVTDATANAVASAIATAINANANFGATALANVVTITNAAVGKATDIADGDTGFTVAVTTQGVDAESEGNFALEAGDKVTFIGFRDIAQRNTYTDII